MCFFFFSSRRRHTRYWRDWSSDVCSSDLRPRVHGLREIFDAIFYVVRSGCAWRLLPGDFAPWQTVYYHFRRLRLDGLWHLILKALRKTTRRQAGKHPEPSAAIIDAQSIKTTVESARYSGYDGHKKVKGRKRHLQIGRASCRERV